MPERADGLLDELLEVGDVLERGWRAGVPEGVRDRVERSGDLVLKDLLDGAAFLLEEVELAVGGAPRGGVAVGGRCAVSGFCGELKKRKRY